MLVSAVLVLDAGWVAVKRPPLEGDVTVTSDVFELTAVNVLTPASDAVKLCESLQPDGPPL
jgi:hypothetical protein